MRSWTRALAPWEAWHGHMHGPHQIYDEARQGAPPQYILRLHYVRSICAWVVVVVVVVVVVAGGGGRGW